MGGKGRENVKKAGDYGVCSYQWIKGTTDKENLALSCPTVRLWSIASASSPLVTAVILLTGKRDGTQLWTWRMKIPAKKARLRGGLNGSLSSVDSLRRTVWTGHTFRYPVSTVRNFQLREAIVCLRMLVSTAPRSRMCLRTSALWPGTTPHSASANSFKQWAGRGGGGGGWPLWASTVPYSHLHVKCVHSTAVSAKISVWKTGLPKEKSPHVDIKTWFAYTCTCNFLQIPFLAHQTGHPVLRDMWVIALPVWRNKAEA